MYVVVRVEQNAETGNYNRQTYQYDDIDSAEQQFHSIMASDIGSDKLGYALCVVMDDAGNVAFRRKWIPEEVTNA